MDIILVRYKAPQRNTS